MWSCCFSLGFSCVVLSIPLLPWKNQNNSARIYWCQRVSPSSCKKGTCFCSGFSNSVQQVGCDCAIAAWRDSRKNCFHAERNGKSSEAILWAYKCASNFVSSSDNFHAFLYLDTGLYSKFFFSLNIPIGSAFRRITGEKSENQFR